MRLSPSWLVLGLVAAAYAGAVSAGFVWDDHALVETNRAVTDPTWQRVFGQDLWCCGGAVRSAYYRPVLTLSLVADHALWGMRAAGYHLTSLAAHLGAVALVFALARPRLGVGRAAVASAIFGLHPVQSEAVVWVAARNDLLAAVGVLATLLLLERPTRARVVAAVGTGLLACLSKESAVLLPVLALAWGAPGTTGRGRDAVGVRLAATGAAVVLALALRLTADLGSPGAGSETRPESAADLLGGAATVLGWVSWPWPLTSTATFFRAPPAASAWPAALVTLAGLGWLAWRGQGRYLLVAACAFAPAVAGILRYGTLGERYLYLPMAGLALAVAAAVPERGWVKALGALAAVAAVGVLQVRLPDWRDDVALFTAAVERAPDGFAEAQLGGALARSGESGPALVVLDRSLAHPRRSLYGCLHVATLATSHVRPAALPAALDRWAAAGCTDVPGFVDGAAITLALAGRWDALAAWDPPPGALDGSHRYQVAVGALRLREGDLVGAAALGLYYVAGEGPFRAEIAAVAGE